MSQWTHIKGSLKVSSGPHECRKIKIKKPTSLRNEENNEQWDKWRKAYLNSTYLPFPQEQVKISMPTIISYSKGFYTQFDMVIYSLPRAKKYIDEAFSLLPYGELGWHPAIKQGFEDSVSSSSYMDNKCDIKAFQESILNSYNNKDVNYGFWDWKTLKKCQNIELGWVHNVNDILIGIQENIRHCSGEEMLEGLENFFNCLEKHDIEIDEGYLEWVDDWNQDFYFVCRIDTSFYPQCARKFMKIEKETNKIVWSKSYTYKKVDDKIDLESTFRHEYDIVEENFNK